MLCTMTTMTMIVENPLKHREYLQYLLRLQNTKKYCKSLQVYKTMIVYNHV